jgi:hypothetical protein
MPAAVLKHDHRFGNLLWAKPRIALCGNEDRFLLKCTDAVELWDRLCHKRCVDFVRQNCCLKLCRIARPKLEANFRAATSVSS